MKTFNQLGAVCLPDTHDRFATEIASTAELDKTVWDDLSKYPHKIVDNFDMLQSSAVY